MSSLFMFVSQRWVILNSIDNQYEKLIRQTFCQVEGEVITLGNGNVAITPQ
jgi:hypothetical protein